jgi:hypothetical protein
MARISEEDEAAVRVVVVVPVVSDESQGAQFGVVKCFLKPIVLIFRSPI